DQLINDYFANEMRQPRRWVLDDGKIQYGVAMSNVEEVAIDLQPAGNGTIIIIDKWAFHWEGFREHVAPLLQHITARALLYASPRPVCETVQESNPQPEPQDATEAPTSAQPSYSSTPPNPNTAGWTAIFEWFYGYGHPTLGMTVRGLAKQLDISERTLQ